MDWPDTVSFSNDISGTAYCYKLGQQNRTMDFWSTFSLWVLNYYLLFFDRRPNLDQLAKTVV